MARILVLGGGLIGLTTALLLARDGHPTTVLERDPDGPDPAPDRLWDDWDRPGVSQFRQPHFLQPRWYREAARELPEVIDELKTWGARPVNAARLLPFSFVGGARAGDDRYDTLAVRRPVLEAAVASVAARTPGIEIRRGIRVLGLSLRSGAGARVPRVTGVLTSAGEILAADLVVDASGRRTTVPAMLAQAGARPPLREHEDSGFVYYARHYRSAGGAGPSLRGTMLQHFHGLSMLTLPADGDTWAVGVVASSRDHAVRGLRDESAWARAVSLFDTVAPWIDGAPLTGVQVIAGLEDRYRRYVIDGRPVVSGLVAVGDAWACTNPSLGRGAAIGVLHALALRDTLRDNEVGDDLVPAFDAATEAGVTPYFDATRATDRHRLAEIEADVAGRPYLTPDPGFAVSKALAAAAPGDPELVRAYLDLAGMLALPAQVFGVAGLIDRVMAAGAGAPQYPTGSPRHDDVVAAVTRSGVRTG